MGVGRGDSPHPACYLERMVRWRRTSLELGDVSRGILLVVDMADRGRPAGRGARPTLQERLVVRDDGK